MKVPTAIRTIAYPVIKSPRDQTLVSDSHPVEPLIEVLERARDRVAALVCLDCGSAQYADSIGSRRKTRIATREPKMRW